MSSKLAQPRHISHVGTSKWTARTALHSIILTTFASTRARTVLSVAAIASIAMIAGTGTAWAWPSMQGN